MRSGDVGSCFLRHGDGKVQNTRTNLVCKPLTHCIYTSSAQFTSSAIVSRTRRMLLRYPRWHLGHVIYIENAQVSVHLKFSNNLELIMDDVSSSILYLEHQKQSTPNSTHQEYRVFSPRLSASSFLEYLSTNINNFIARHHAFGKRRFHV